MPVPSTPPQWYDEAKDKPKKTIAKPKGKAKAKAAAAAESDDEEDSEDEFDMPGLI